MVSGFRIKTTLRLLALIKGGLNCGVPLLITSSLDPKAAVSEIQVLATFTTPPVHTSNKTHHLCAPAIFPDWCQIRGRHCGGSACRGSMRSNGCCRFRAGICIGSAGTCCYGWRPLAKDRGRGKPDVLYERTEGLWLVVGHCLRSVIVVSVKENA